MDTPHNRKYRIVALILVLIMGLLLTACGLGTADTPAESQDDTGETESQQDADKSGSDDQSAGGEGETGAEGEVDIHCTETDPHPVGQSIADTYDVTYEEVMTWFCTGYSFDNILLALETSQQAELTAGELLEMNLEMTWDEIWAELGIVVDG